MGAFITLILLTFEPFTQQVIQFGTRNAVLANETGFISYSHSLNTGQLVNSGYKKNGESAHVLISSISRKITWRSVAGSTLGVEMMAALAGKSPTYPSNVDCPTSACSFPNFTSLGSCTECQSHALETDRDMNCTYDLNSSGRTQREMNCTLRLEDFLLYKGPGFNITYTKEDSGPSLGVVSPVAYNGLEVFFGNTFVKPGPPDEGPLNFCISTPMTKITTPPGEIHRFLCFNTSKNPLEDVETDRNEANFPRIKGTVTECRVDLCAKHFQQISTDDGSPKFSITTKPLSFTEPEFDVLDDSNDPIAWTAHLKDDITFTFNVTSWKNLTKAFIAMVYSVSFKETIEHPSYEMGWQTVYERMTNVITDYIRSSDNSSAQRYTGQAFQVQATIEVQLLWLILPIGAVLLSVSFLVVTMMYSGRKSYLFKNSLLPAIFYGLNVGRGKGDGLVEKTDEKRQTDIDVMKMAANMKVNFVSDGNGNLGLVREQ